MVALAYRRSMWTPAAMAHLESKGEWRIAPHLERINLALMEAAAGRWKRVCVSVPPRHGKSELISKYFPVWHRGYFPGKRVLVAGYSDDFAAEWGRKARDIYDEFGAEFFGTGGVKSGVDAASRWEIEGEKGQMLTAGIGGPILGKGFDFGIIDDPHKNYEEASSPTIRDMVWNWYMSTFHSRQEPGASIMVVMQRWHPEDLIGRLKSHERKRLSRGEEIPDALRWRFLDFPALSRGDGDILGRPEGGALWPERYDEAALKAIRSSIDPYLWLAQYQQEPASVAGKMFRRDWLRPRANVSEIPAYSHWCSPWDLAGSEGKGDYTAGPLIARSPQGVYFVADMERFRYEGGERDRRILATNRRRREMVAALNGSSFVVRGEQEPGSAGKDAARAFRSLHDGFDVATERPDGNKEARARILASAFSAGDVVVCHGEWNADYEDEFADFPDASHDDQVDSTSLGHRHLSSLESSGYGPSPTDDYRGDVADPFEW